jgi:VCBS repeat-containing protein
MTLLTNKNKSINELFNITDPDPDLLSIIITKKPQHGTITINTNGRFTYTPNSNYIGKDYFCYTGNDGLLNSNTATITINIQN